LAPRVAPDPVETAARIDALRRSLPPINPPTWRLEGTVCVDCEWREDSDGRPVLTEIGVGNDKVVVHVDWALLNSADRDRTIRWFVKMIAERPVVIHNAAADIKVLRRAGFPLVESAFFRLEDTMLAHAVLHSEEDHDLGYLIAEYRLGAEHKDLRLVDGAREVYNAADVVRTAELFEKCIGPELLLDRQAARVYREQSLPFMWLAMESEEAGIAVDPVLPPLLYEKYDVKREQARRLLIAYAGWPANIASPADMKHLLYNIERMPFQFKKGAGRRPTPEDITADKDAISALRRSFGTEWDPDVAPTLASTWQSIEEGGHPALEARYLFMGAQQAVSHYIEPLLKDDGTARERIYPECRVHVQASGRVGYVRPALPQLKGELLDQLLPDEGHVWIGHDWKQIEVRLLAVLADDRVYLDAFDRGEDIHGLNARAIFPVVGSKELEEIRRRWIKAFAFRLHYRGKPENAGDIPGTRALGLDALSLIVASERYLARHPALAPYWATVEAEADANRCVRTFMGRPRRLTGWSKSARNREASNQPMQGGVSDIFITTALAVKRAAPWARLVFGAYDSHWWQVPAEREMAFLALYVPIVEREFVINGKAVRFPADYKRRAR
jgi:DNA polymerase I-like protein with 3'-5' exonuclease and polymerase domains